MTAKSKQDNAPAPKPSKAAAPKKAARTRLPTLPLTVLAQYVKDISFETPGPIALAREEGGEPQVTLNVEVTAADVGPDLYEVALHLNAKVLRTDENVFVLEMIYAGLVGIEDMPEDARTELLMVQAPQLLFPFARSLVAHLTREGGLPPLVIEPLDFAQMYKEKGGK